MCIRDRPRTWTTPPPWPTAGRSPPGSSKAQHDSSSRTGWTSPARGGPPLAPKPSCTCAPSSPTATSTSTGNGTNSKNSAATTSTTTNNSILQPDPQLTAEEPHSSVNAKNRLSSPSSRARTSLNRRNAPLPEMAISSRSRRPGSSNCSMNATMSLYAAREPTRCTTSQRSQSALSSGSTSSSSPRYSPSISEYGYTSPV